MPCCGDKRSQLTATPRETEPAVMAGTEQYLLPPQTVRFRYEGPTALTVMGPITRSRYRFAFAGATLDVDSRDASSMAAVPHLRRAAH
jgi:hypothetical protein